MPRGVLHHTKETKNKISRSLKGRKLSEEHKRKLSESTKLSFLKYPNLRKRLSEIWKGERCNFWKGGISPINQKIRQSLEYKIWRKEVYKKDKWQCRLCGYKGNKIVAHHLELFSDFPELRFSVDNGITLCRHCHAIIHNQLKNGG